MAATAAAAVQAFAVVYFNGMGSTRLQGLRYANTVVTTRGPGGEVFYTGKEEGDKLFAEVWPAEDFSDVHVEHTGEGVLTGEPRRSSSWRWILGVPDEPGFVFRLVLWKWLPPAHSEHVQKGLRDVRDALAKHARPIVVYGASRGAGLLFLVMEHLTTDERARIHLAVAEAPFDSMWNVVLDRLGQLLPRVVWLMEFVRPLGNWLPFRARAPLDAEFPHDVPLIMASGTEDESCMFTGQQRLARKLRASNHPDFAHIVIEGANHNNIWQHSAFKKAVRSRLP